MTADPPASEEVDAMTDTQAQARRRATHVGLDRALELLPLFRLADSGEEDTSILVLPNGSRWRVLPSPDDRLPGTFDQDAYVELMHRLQGADYPEDGVVRFTLHAFLRAMGRKVDGRTYEQLRTALVRLERTTLEAIGPWAGGASPPTGAFTLLSGVVVERRRGQDREQLPLFGDLQSAEPGDARATVALPIRTHLAAGMLSHISLPLYRAVGSPVARRLYRLLAAVAAAAADHDTAMVPGTVELEEGAVRWAVPLENLAEHLPLAQRYPSHRQRVLDPSHAVLLEAGIAERALIRQHGNQWIAEYTVRS